MALRSFRDRDPLVVGVVCVVVLSLAVVITFLTGTLGWLEPGYRMSGVFADTGGIKTGDDVRVAGVRVGEITAVEPEFEKTRILITWKVDPDVKLGRTTRAEIRMANVLGGRFLRLSGPVSPPYMADLPDRDRRVPLERTQVPITVNEALKGATRVVSGLDTKALGTILDQLQGISEHGRGRAGNALATLARLNETVADADPQIREVLANAEKVTALVSVKDRQLVRLLAQVQGLLGQLRERRAELAAILGSGSGAVTGISRLIDSRQEELIAVLRDLDATLADLRPYRSGVNNLLAWAGPSAAGLGGMGGYGPWIEVISTGLGPISPQDLGDLVGGARRSRP